MRRGSRTHEIRALLMTFAVAGALTLAGCGVRASQDDAGTLNFLIESAPVNLDPRFAGDAQSQAFDGLIFSSLVAHDSEMNIVPDLAASWETPDPLTYVLSPAQRREVSGRARAYSDGREVHFRFDFERDSGGGWSGSLAQTWVVQHDHVGGCAGCGDGRVSSAPPHAAFLWEMARPAVGIVPQGAGIEVKRQPVGTGPFRLVSMTQDEELVLERNPNYFGAATDDIAAAAGSAEGGGKLAQRIRFRVVPEAIVRALELRKGSADIGGVNSLPSDTVLALKEKAGLVVEDDPGTSFTYIAFNFDDPIIAHREVRQALAYATDRPSIVRYLLRGQARLAPRRCRQTIGRLTQPQSNTDTIRHARSSCWRPRDSGAGRTACGYIWR